MSFMKKSVSIGNYICVILLLALVCVQLFMPFYTHTYKSEELEVSLGEYVWFPQTTENKALTNHFTNKEMFGKDFKIDEVAYPHLYMLILAGFGMVFCLLKNRSFIPSLFGLSAGIIAIVNFSSNAALVLGEQYAERVVSNPTACLINIILGALLVLVSLVASVSGAIVSFTSKTL